MAEQAGNKPAVHMIGNAHLDPVWLWQWPEGYQEVKATFLSALERMEENGDYVFTCAGADYYRFVEENAPALFERVRERVREGRWVIVGGMWIQPDVNLPSGESFARQLLYSQRYFQEKFGVTATTGYNVDSFGHGGMLPALLRAAGINSYVWMRPQRHENAEIPEGAMRWRALDGSEVTAFRIPSSYNASGNEVERMKEALEAADRQGTPQMCFYGVGNHGGGPTIAALRTIDRFRAEDPRGGEVAYSSPDAYFAQLAESGAALPVWEGELQHHASGCYSTHSRLKRAHRRAENALLRAEKLGVLAKILAGHQPDRQGLNQGWRNVMFNQFHDILGGCCIRDALDDALVAFDEALSIAAREENAARQRISWSVDTRRGDPRRVCSKDEDWVLWSSGRQGTPVVVFNPHSFPASGEVRIGRPIKLATDDEGNETPCQLVRAQRTNGEDCWDGLFRAQVPAFGYRLYWVYLERGERGAAAPGPVFAAEDRLENERICARFDPHTGALISLRDKETGREALRAPTRTRLLDIEHCDTWAHGVFRFDKPAGDFSDASVQVTEQGPVRAALRITTRFGASVLVQRFTLYAGSDQLEVEAVLDFHERFRMMKLDFPLAEGADRAVAEIAAGVIERSANGEEETCQRWVALDGGEAGGLGIVNDGKYSYSAENGVLSLTIANSSMFADHFGRRDEDGEWLDQGEQAFRYAIVPYTGDWRSAGFSRRAALLNQPLPSVVESYHDGPLPAEHQGLALSGETVELDAVKEAEDGDGYILRLRETTGRPVKTSLDVGLTGSREILSLRPFELVTLRLGGQSGALARRETLTETI